MKKIFIIGLLIITTCFYFAKNVFALREDAGDRISRTDVTSPVIKAMFNYRGVSPSQPAIIGVANSIDPGENSFGGVGVKGESYKGTGVQGIGKTGVSGIAIDEYCTGVEGSYINNEGGGYGVTGRVNSPMAVGVMGWNPNGIAVLAYGDLSVYRDIRVDGQIIQTGYKYKNINRLGLTDVQQNWLGDVKIDILQWDAAGNEVVNGPNSQYHTGGYQKDKMRDGIYGFWDFGEYASNGVKPRWNDQTSWLGIRMKFPDNVPVYIDKIDVYPRPNPVDQILDAWVTIEYTDKNPYSLRTGAFPFGGVVRPIVIPEGQRENIKSIMLKITDSVPGILNAGVAEIECWGMEMNKR